MDSYTSLAKLYDGFSFDAGAGEWAGYVCELLKTNGVKKGGRILDAGCGTGKLTLEIYKAGFDVTALDSSPYMLETAARRFAEAGAAIQIVNQDMREISLHGKTDAALCINDGINYLTGQDDALKAFKGIYSILNEGGVFLFDISSKHKLESMDGKSYFEENDEGLYIWRNEYDKKSDILTMDISLYSHVEDDLYEKSIETHRQRAYGLPEILELLKAAGFTDVKAFDCFSLNEPLRDSNRIQFLAVKKPV